VDGIYRYIEFDTFHPGAAVIITLLLAFLPFGAARAGHAHCAAVGRHGNREAHPMSADEVDNR
jgi:hypothetical protein